MQTVQVTRSILLAQREGCGGLYSLPWSQPRASVILQLQYTLDKEQETQVWCLRAVSFLVTMR